MRVRIVYFAAARELAECSSEELDVPTDTLTGVAAGSLSLSACARWLGERKPRLAPYLVRMRFALNGEFAKLDAHVKDGDEITVMPPVAGGALLAEVRDAPLSIDEVVAAVRATSAGAIAIFLGVVRDHHQGKPVQRLDYEAYRELANKELQRIVAELTHAEPDVRIAALHRVGELSVGDTAVVVAASSPHREAAFRLCRAAIDRIKDSVPIWKKEWAPSGEGIWINLEGDERN